MVKRIQLLQKDVYINKKAAPPPQQPKSLNSSTGWCRKSTASIYHLAFSICWLSSPTASVVPTFEDIPQY